MSKLSLPGSLNKQVICCSIPSHVNKHFPGYIVPSSQHKYNIQTLPIIRIGVKLYPESDGNLKIWHSFNKINYNSTIHKIEYIFKENPALPLLLKSNWECIKQKQSFLISCCFPCNKYHLDVSKEIELYTRW